MKFKSKLNQIKLNQIKSNQIKSNQIKSNQIKSNQIKSNQIKSNQIKSNQIKSNQIKSNQIKSNQIKSNQIKSNQIKSNQIKSNQIKLSDGEDIRYINFNIPKIVHQTFPTKNLPHQLLSNLEKLKSLNPGWEFRLYDDRDIEDFISSEFPELMQYYKRINPSYGAARADFFRYLLLYKSGGIYLDIKSSVSKPLDEIASSDKSFILSYWTNGYGKHPSIQNPNGEF